MAMALKQEPHTSKISFVKLNDQKIYFFEKRYEIDACIVMWPYFVDFPHSVGKL